MTLQRHVLTRSSSDIAFPSRADSSSVAVTWWLFLLLWFGAVTAAAEVDGEASWCEEGTFFSAGNCLFCPDARWCRAGNECRYGHEGWACSSCIEEYFLGPNDVCKECPKKEEAQMAYGSTALGMVMFSLIMYWTESGHDVTTFTIGTGLIDFDDHVLDDCFGLLTAIDY